MEKKIAVYPGTFDPVTFGHIDVLKRASKLFDKVIISVAESSSKNSLFTAAERMKMIKESTGNIKNCSVDKFGGLLVKYAESKKACAVIRGLRAISDFEYELQMALTNRNISTRLPQGRGIETVFFMPNEKYIFISSTLVKEIASLGGDLKSFVPPAVLKMLKKKFKIPH